MSARERVEQEAALWLARRDNLGDDLAVDPDFEAWLAAAPEHRIAFWRLENSWQGADRLTSAPQAGASRGVSGSRIRPSWLRPMALAASLILAACIGGGVLQVIQVPPQHSLHTDIGGRRMTTLADGSSIELNANTRVRTRIDNRRREVWLDQGEAYFEIEHDPSRPFVVHAGSRAVTVLGTRFLVRRTGDQVTVAVREGKVRVEGERSAARALILKPGQIAVADGESTLISADSTEKVEQALSWRTGFITFDGTTLADAALEFNRYNRKKMTVAPDAAGIRISGIFEARNVAAFSRLMRDGLDLEVVDTETEISIAASK